MTVFLFLDQIRLSLQNYYLMVYTLEYLWFLASVALLLGSAYVWVWMYGYELKYQIHHMDKSYYSPLRTERMQLSGEESNIWLPKASLISEQWSNQCFIEVDRLSQSCTFSWYIGQLNNVINQLYDSLKPCAICYEIWKIPSCKAKHADVCNIGFNGFNGLCSSVICICLCVTSNVCFCCKRPLCEWHEYAFKS